MRYQGTVLPTCRRLSIRGRVPQNPQRLSGTPAVFINTFLPDAGAQMSTSSLSLHCATRTTPAQPLHWITSGLSTASLGRSSHNLIYRSATTSLPYYPTHWRLPKTPQVRNTGRSPETLSTIGGDPMEICHSRWPVTEVSDILRMRCLSRLI